MDSFPPLYAVWRPSLGRWQFCKTRRSESGHVRGFCTVWGAYTAVVHHVVDTRASARPCKGLVAGKPVSFRRVNEMFLVSELVESNDRMEVVERRIPVLDFTCWRRLPRTCV